MQLSADEFRLFYHPLVKQNKPFPKLILIDRDQISRFESKTVLASSE